MAADPKDTTVTEDNTEQGTVAVATKPASASPAKKLSAEEQAALYTDVDALDPETIARGGGGSHGEGDGCQRQAWEARGGLAAPPCSRCRRPFPRPPRSP